MSQKATVLVFDVGAIGLGELATRMRRLRLSVVHARSLDEADRILDAEPGGIRAVFFPPDLDASALSALSERLQAYALERPATRVVTGAPADAETRRQLREAGVDRALWEPCDDATLRFVVNEALAAPDAVAAREGVRVPTALVARIEAGGRSKEALVYSLSSSGSFLETPRPSMRGAHVQVEVTLPDGPFAADAHVVFANVPGNLQRPKLPLGMGVRFDDLSREDSARLRRYVELQAARISV